MHADSVVVYYGLRLEIGADADLEDLAHERDERQQRARAAELHSLFGRLTAGAPHFLLVGTEIGIFGVEAGHERQLWDADFAALMARTRRRLRSAGFQGEPALHVQLLASF